MKKLSKPKLIALVCALCVLVAAFVFVDVKLFAIYSSAAGKGFAGFPSKDTGADADYSYQTDNVRIAVYEYNEYPDVYWVGDVWVKNLDAFQSIFSEGEYNSSPDLAETMARKSNAILAINSDWNDGIVFRNGEYYGIDYTLGGAQLVMYKDGSMEAFDCSYDVTPEQLEEKGAWNSWSFGPVLVRDGKPVENLEQNGFAPRTAIGYYSPGHYCFFVCDGRQSGYAVGMDYSDMADLFVKLGCKLAFNLDGGASSQILFNGKIINNPAPASEGQRLLQNMIAIVEPEPESEN